MKEVFLELGCLGMANGQRVEIQTKNSPVDCLHLAQAKHLAESTVQVVAD